MRLLRYADLERARLVRWKCGRLRRKRRKPDIDYRRLPDGDRDFRIYLVDARMDFTRSSSARRCLHSKRIFRFSDDHMGYAPLRKEHHLYLHRLPDPKPIIRCGCFWFSDPCKRNDMELWK